MTKTILLACNAGMSTSLLVEKMKQAAAKEQLDTDISATAAAEVESILATKKVDALLLGPQVRFMLPQFQQKFGQQTAVAVINSVDYGTMNGANVLKQALDLIEKAA